MSATKNYFEQVFQEEHMTDDTYEDFMRMQREHQIQEELNLVEHDEEILIQHSPKSQINWEEQANGFLAGSKAPISDLPF